MKKICLTALIIFALIFALMPSLQAQSPQETLNQYIADLQNNPNDYALREKIIRHVQGMKQKPAISEEANRHFIMADTFRQKAKDNKGYELAISEYREALLIAPWWAAAYNNMGILLEQVGRYDEAISALKLYIATNPPDARAAQNKIYQIEAAKKMAAQESSPQTVAAREQKKSDDWLKKLDGRRYTCPSGNATLVLDVRGKVFVYGNITPESGYYGADRFEISGRVTSRRLTREQQSGGMTLRFWVVEGTYTISEDGDRITQRLRYNDGDVREYIYLWQR